MIEHGHGMRASTALKIAEALGCSLEDLLRGDADTSTAQS